jgi:hypothetical protein
MKLRMKYEDGQVLRTDLKNFCRDNREDPSLCRKASRLRPGQSFYEGGGASPLVKISRTRRKK